VRFAATGQFCPRRAVVTKARLLPEPAKTMSRGSSQVASVRVTCERAMVGSSSTMLTLSERWFTTHASVRPARFVRAATATGSSPTGTSAASVSDPTPTV
jgi:hypothetical protein